MAFCFYCGTELDERNRSTARPHHLDAGEVRSHAACRYCRSQKGPMPLEAYRLWKGLHTGRLPYKFALERQQSRRDMIAVVSPKLIIRLVEHNMGWLDPRGNRSAQ